MSTTLIKIGGEIFNESDSLNNLMLSIKMIIAENENVILVHGGGPQATALSAKLGIMSKMIGGRRVTCKDTLEVMKMVLPGTVSSDLIATCNRHKIIAAAAPAYTFMKATKRPPKPISGSSGELVDFGLVGDIESMDATLINLLLKNKILPVVSPLCSDHDGRILNVNADSVASYIAKEMRVNNFIAVTSVGGIYKDINDQKCRYPKLTINEAKKLIEENIISGGMIPKVEEAFPIVDSGITKFFILKTTTAAMLYNELKNPGTVGTLITNE